MKIVMETVQAVRLDGQFIKFKAGASIDPAHHEAGVLAQIEAVLVDHSAGLEAEIAKYLQLRPKAQSVAAAMATYLYKQP